MGHPAWGHLKLSLAYLASVESARLSGSQHRAVPLQKPSACFRDTPWFGLAVCPVFESPMWLVDTILEVQFCNTSKSESLGCRKGKLPEVSHVVCVGEGGQQQALGDWRAVGRKFCGVAMRRGSRGNGRALQVHTCAAAPSPVVFPPPLPLSRALAALGLQFQDRG